MAKAKREPRYKVVSLRLNDQEREDLQKVADRKEQSIGTVLREAFTEYCKAIPKS